MRAKNKGARKFSTLPLIYVLYLFTYSMYISYLFITNITISPSLLLLPSPSPLYHHHANSLFPHGYRFICHYIVIMLKIEYKKALKDRFYGSLFAPSLPPINKEQPKKEKNTGQANERTSE